MFTQDNRSTPTGLVWKDQQDRRFIVLEHQYGRRDVMWKRSIYQTREKPASFPFVPREFRCDVINAKIGREDLPGIQADSSPVIPIWIARRGPNASNVTDGSVRDNGKEENPPALPLTALLSLLESFSNDEGDGNENVKTAIGLLSKTTSLQRALRFFVHFFAVTARLRLENA